MVLADPAEAQGRGGKGQTLGDEAGGPQVAVLLGEGHQLAVDAGAGRSPGVGEQHEGEQAGHLGVVGQGVVHAPGQADASPDRSVRARSGPLLVA